MALDIKILFSPDRCSTTYLCPRIAVIPPVLPPDVFSLHFYASQRIGNFTVEQSISPRRKAISPRFRGKSRYFVVRKLDGHNR
jgi:hypothetical protein